MKKIKIKIFGNTLLLIYAIVLSFGSIFMLKQSNVIAYTSGSSVKINLCTTFTDSSGRYSSTNYLDALYGAIEYNITNISITNIKDDRIDNGVIKQTIDVSYNEDGSINAYVFEMEDENHVKYYDCVIYGDYETIKIDRLYYSFAGNNMGPGGPTSFKNVKTMDLSILNTEDVIIKGNTFHGCSNLEKLDISNFDLSSINADSGGGFKDYRFFEECTSLEVLYLPKELNEDSSLFPFPSGTWIYNEVEYVNPTLGTFSFMLSNDTTKRVVYKSTYEGEKIYEVPRQEETEETGVFVDIVLPTVFVALTGTLACMYVLQARKQKQLVLR